MLQSGASHRLTLSHALLPEAESCAGSKRRRESVCDGAALQAVVTVARGSNHSQHILTAANVRTKPRRGSMSNSPSDKLINCGSGISTHVPPLVSFPHHVSLSRGQPPSSIQINVQAASVKDATKRSTEQAASGAARPCPSPSLRVQMYCAGKSFEQQVLTLSADDEFSDSLSQRDTFLMRCTGVPGVSPRLRAPPPADATLTGTQQAVDRPVDGVRWFHPPHAVGSHRGQLEPLPLFAPPPPQPPSTDSLSELSPNCSANFLRSDCGAQAPQSTEDRASVRWVHPALLELEHSA